jgi:hypothetical protein
VALICGVFGVDRSSYKYWVKRANMPILKRIKLLSELRSAHQDSNGWAGARTIATIVTDPGIQLSRYGTTRVMKELELVSRIRFVAVSLSPDSVLIGQALSMAFDARAKPRGVMFHSDQARHYSSRKFRQHCGVIKSSRASVVAVTAGIRRWSDSFGA